MSIDTYTKIINDPNAPNRLLGKKITIIIDMSNMKLQFDCELPDNPTPQELGYVRLTCTELAAMCKNIKLESRTEKIVRNL